MDSTDATRIISLVELVRVSGSQRDARSQKPSWRDSEMPEGWSPSPQTSESGTPKSCQREMTSDIDQELQNEVLHGDNAMAAVLGQQLEMASTSSEKDRLVKEYAKAVNAVQQ